MKQLIVVPMLISALHAVLADAQPARIERVAGDRQIVVGTDTAHGPIQVRVLDRSGAPLDSVDVYGGYSNAGPPGVYFVDPFGFRGFNVYAQDYVWPGPFYNGFARTNGEGVATIRNGIVEAAPASAPVAALVIRPGYVPDEAVPWIMFSEVRVVAPPPGQPMVVVEYYHAGLSHFFVTGLQGEIDLLDAGVFSGWARSIGAFIAYENAAAAPPGAVPVCRFFSSVFTSHFYTADPAECDTVITRWSDVWTLETREAFYIFEPNKVTGECGSGLQPIYRMYNNQPVPNHRYITDRKLRDRMVGYGWRAEGYGPEAVMLCTPK